MNLRTPTKVYAKNVSETWKRVLAGDVQAYQAVVESNQSAVSAVAYGIVGDFPISQDIAQETFWVAWRKRGTLRDAGRLKGWLCGISRNLARNWRRHNAGPSASTSRDGAELDAGVVSSIEDPVVQSMAREEAALVWSALEELPESYREVLTLYYREGESISDVAEALEINVDAARQRLNRGRIMLKGRVAQVVEGVLLQTAPNKAFTVKVIAGLVSAGTVAKSGTATASSVTAAQASSVGAVTVSKLATGTVMGMIGGLVGTVAGLGGAFVGIWLPAQFVPTETERQLLMRRGRIIMGICLAYTVAFSLIAGSFVIGSYDARVFISLCIGITVPFVATVTLCSLRLRAQCDELRQHVKPENDPNQSRLASYAMGNSEARTSRQGRRWTSQLRLWGLPLVDVQFADVEHGLSEGEKKPWGRASGWIAVGDVATGVIAIGKIARGIVAIGGVSIGVFSIGGLALGLMSLGGLAAGVLAIGGGAIGWTSAGGLAVGLHAAAGGLAVAWHVAAGGSAFAHDFAIGGLAVAAEINTPLAERVAKGETMWLQILWLIKNQGLVSLVVAAAIVLPLLVIRRTRTAVNG